MVDPKADIGYDIVTFVRRRATDANAKPIAFSAGATIYTMFRFSYKTVFSNKTAPPCRLGGAGGSLLWTGRVVDLCLALTWTSPPRLGQAARTEPWSPGTGPRDAPILEKNPNSTKTQGI